MKREHTDLLISGGGIAGMAAAAAFGAAGYSVILVDPVRPVTDRKADGADMRSTAFLQPAARVLEAAGAWPHLEPFAAPLQVMRVVDAGGEDTLPRVSAEFDAADISDLPFGWNVPNWAIRKGLLARLEDLPGVRFLQGRSTSTVLTRETEVLVTLSDGSQVSCRLLVAADGRESAVRNAVGIDARTTRFGQKALAFSVTHDVPHQNVSTEVHRSGGPFTLVPLPDLDGRPASAIVWMDEGPKIQRLAELDTSAFEAEMTERSAGVLGPLRLASRRAVWPIIARIARRFHAQRTALIAEAAHVVPPIGAQGLNMSLADIDTLLDLAGTDPGLPEVLTAYTRRRWPDVQARVAGVSALNRASIAGAQPIRDLRAEGLKLIHGVSPIRKTLMRAGLGA